MKTIFDRIEQVCGFEIVDRERIQGARTGIVYKIIDGDGKVWAVKITKREQIWGDVYFYEKIRKTDICVVPEVIFFKKINKNFVMVTEWLSGNSGERQDCELGKDIGEKMYKIHKIRVDGCGQRNDLGWQYKNWNQFMKKACKNNIDAIAKLGCKEETKAVVLKKYKEGLASLGKVELGLCHGDLGMDNMIIKDNLMFGLIDTGWIVGGDGLTDIAYLINGQYENKEFVDGLMSGYGEVDENKLVFYRLLAWLGKINYNLTIGNEKKYKRISGEIIKLVSN